MRKIKKNLYSTNYLHLFSFVLARRQIVMLLLLVFMGGLSMKAQVFVATADALQNALTVNSKDIQVKHGEYQLTKTLIVKTGVKLTGGYTQLNTRGGQGVTTLKAKDGQRAITLDGGTMDGFAITNGKDDIAGGVYFLTGGTLKNCLITNNTDIDGVGVGGDKTYTNNVQYCTIADNIKSTFNYVTVKNIRWATGNLQGNGTGTGAKIAAPAVPGDFARMASLILYPIQDKGVAAKPSAYSSTAWQNTPFGNSPKPTSEMNNQVPSDDATKGVGDACRYYLKEKWRLPNDTELQSIAAFDVNDTKNYTESTTAGDNCILIPADLPEVNLSVRMTGFVNQAGQQVATNYCSWWWCSNWTFKDNANGYGRGLGFGFTGVDDGVIGEQIRYDNSDRSITDGSSIRCVYATEKTN